MAPSIRLPLLVTVALGLAASACENPVCADDVAGRLYRECGVSFGPWPVSTCTELSGAPADPLAPELEAHYIAQCEAMDPQNWDVDCLRELDCSSGTVDRSVCFRPDPDSTLDTLLLNCPNECGSVSFTCQEACRADDDFDACLPCELECQREEAACVRACPDA